MIIIIYYKEIKKYRKIQQIGKCKNSDKNIITISASSMMK
jgi:hypothetical protein